MNVNGYEFPITYQTQNMKVAGIYWILKNNNPYTGWNNSLFDSWLQANNLIGWNKTTSQSDAAIMPNYSVFPIDWKMPIDYPLQYASWINSAPQPEITISDNKNKNNNYILYAIAAIAAYMILIKKK